LAANAGFYGSTAVRLIGAIPHYIDIDPTTLTLSPENLRHALDTKPKAIIVTHLYGQLANVEPIVEAASKIGVPVIEDCAQAHGATRNGSRAGSFGTIGCFSFYPTKNLGALGDGGAVVENGGLAIPLKQLRQYGWSTRFQVEVPGGRNSRLDEMQAAILREKLPYLDRSNSERREVARKYNAAFGDLPLRCPSSLGEDYVAHLYVVQVQNRDSFRRYLHDHGVSTDIHYPIPDHLQRAYLCDQKRGALPVTEQVCEQVVSLPCFPGMSTEQVERVIEVVDRWAKT
jgi:aminotransferase EvaB